MAGAGSSGSEFALAVVRFVADDTQVRAALKNIDTQAKATTTTVGALSATGKTGAFSWGDYADQAHNAGKAINTSKKQVQDAIPQHKAFTGELRHASRLWRETAGNIFGQFMPGMNQAIRGVGGMSRSLKGMGGAMIGGLIAFNLASEAIKYLGEMSEKTIQTGIALTKAQRNLNAAMAEKEVDSAIDQLIEYEARAKAATKPWTSAMDVVGGVFSFWKNKLDDAFGEDQLEKINKARKTFMTLWDSVELPKMKMESTKATLEELGKVLDKEFGEARTNEEREQIAARQSANLASIQAILEAQIKASDQVKLAKIDADIKSITSEVSKGHATTAQIAETAKTIIGLNKQKNDILGLQEEKLAVSRSENNRKRVEEEQRVAKAIMEANLDLMRSQNELTNIAAQSSKDQMAFERSIFELKRSSAEKEAEYQGQMLGGLASYQNERRGMVEAEADAELATAKRLHDQQMALLKEQSTTARGQEAVKVAQQMAAEEAKYTATFTKLSNDRELKMQQENQKAVEEKRAETTKIIALESSKFDLLRAQGKANEIDSVNFAAKIVSMWQVGSTKRLDAEKKLASEVKSLWDKMASAGRALEEMAISALEKEGNLAPTLADIARKTDELTLSAQRLNAQRQAGFGTSQEELSLIRAVGDANKTAKEQGVTMQQQLSVAAKDATVNLSKETQTTDGMVSSLQATGLSIGTVAQRYGELKDAQVTAAQTATLLAEGQVKNTKAMNDSADSMVDYSISAADAGKKSLEFALSSTTVQKAMQESAKAQREADDAWQEVAASEKRAADAAIGVGIATSKSDDKLAQVVENFKGAYGEIQGATDSFYKTMETKITSGNSRIADTVYQYFTNEVIRKLDAEAARS